MTEQKEQKSLKEKVDTSYEIADKIKKGLIKRKDLKLPKKGKVSKSKIKKGYIGIAKIQNNRNISFEKQLLRDHCFVTSDGTYHSTNGNEILFWNGKYPIVFQPTWKLNPISFKEEEDEKNETYGQKYVMAKMMKDAIKQKNKGNFGGIAWIIGIAIAAYIGYSLITGGI